jgi:superfamily II DNA or RNA helicase
VKSTLVVNNSYSDLRNFSKGTLATIDECLTVHNDISQEREYILGQINWLERQVKRFDKTKDSSERVMKIWKKFRQMLGFNKKKLRDLEASEYVHHLHGTTFATGLLHIVKDVLGAINQSYLLEDLRKIPERRHEFILCKDFHEPRYYQSEAHEAAMRDGRGVIESAVGTGKTDMMERIIYNLGVNNLIVVPSKPLMEQLQPILEEHFGRGNVIRLSSKKLSKAKLRKVKKRPIRLINIGSLAAAQKNGNMSVLVDDVDAVFIDEIHHAGSKSYTNLLKDLEHVYYRFGFTGTFLRNDSKTLNLWGFLSTVLYKYPAHQAIKDGFLTPMKAYVHKIEGDEKRQYQAEYKANYCGKVKVVKGQLKVVKRPVKFLKKIQKIFEKYVEDGQQVLILVNRKDQAGFVISEFLNEIGIENTYISGDSDKDEIKQALMDFNAKKISVLIGSQVIGEGIDIRSADHLIMAQGGKSEIAIVQAAGRLVRLFEGKKFGHLHDFRFLNTKYMEKHLIMRKDILQRNFAPKFIRAS